ncbi:MAG: hypothetical protein ACLFS2_10160 [Halochromatium sp.]|uniref:hypothetical protein n=1 Tax=Halochromatium sp. TaxID=2049430 RepID=UPI00397A161C
MNTETPQRERASIVLDASLHRRAKVAAASAGWPLQRLAESALERELARLERQRKRKP